MIDVLVLKNTNRQLNLSILCTQGPLSEKHSRFILTQTHTTLKESDILDCPLHVDLQCSLIKKIFLPASPCVWWCYGGFIQCMVQNKKHQEHTEQQISPWASKIKWFRLLKCVCVLYLSESSLSCMLNSMEGMSLSMCWGSQMIACSSSFTVFLTTPWRPLMPATRILQQEHVKHT